MANWVTLFGTSLDDQEYQRQRRAGSAAHLSVSSSSESIAASEAGGVLLVASGYGLFNIGSQLINDIYGNTHFLVHVVNGTIAWSRKLASSRGYYVLNSITEADAEGSHIINSAGSLYKYSTSGDLLWKRTLPNQGTEHVRCIASFADGSAIIVGSISDTTTPYDFGTGDIVYGGITSSHLNGTAYIAKVSKDGLFEWSRKVQNISPVFVGYQDSLKTFGDGSFVLHYTEIAQTPYSSYQTGSKVEKRDSSGQLIWSSQLSGAYVSALSAMDDGSVIIFASMGKELSIGGASVVQDDFANDSATPRGVIARLNADGTLAWATKTKGIDIQELKPAADSSSKILAIGSKDGVLFIAQIDERDGNLVSSMGFREATKIGYPQWEAKIIDDTTLALAGTFFDNAPANVAGTELIDLDPEWSIYLANIKADFPIRLQPDVTGTAASITGNGEFQEGVILAAGPITGDPDGNGEVLAYQWYLDNQPIGGGNGSAYATTSKGAGTYKVAITYIDGNSAAVTATVESPSQLVRKINNGAGMADSIASSKSGVFHEGVSLVAGGVIADPDGISSEPMYAYQWYKNDIAIGGATQETYVVSSTGAGTYRVAIGYTDAQGHNGTVNSRNQIVAAVDNGIGKADPITSPTGGVFREGVTLGAGNVTRDPDGMPSNPRYAYQWYRNNLPIQGAIQKTYVVPKAGSGTYRVAITYLDAQGFQGTVNSTNQIIGKIATGTPRADRLTGTAGQDLMMGLGGADRLIGGASADIFRYTNLGESRLATLDRITDFSIGTDTLDAPRAVIAARLKELGRVSALNQSSIEKVLGKSNSALGKKVFNAHQAATFSFGSGRSGRTFLALNNDTAGFDASRDGLIEITGFNGSLTDLEIA